MEDSDMKTDLHSDWEQYAEEGHRRAMLNWTVGGLLAAGLLLVLFAESFGKLSAQHWNPSAGWYPEEAHAAANTFRALGLMSFVGGIGERIILVIRSLHPPL